MPIERDPITSIPSRHLRPSLADDGRGNAVSNGPDTVIGNCFAGVIPEDIRHNPYREIGGGEINLSRWTVVVRNAPTAAIGDAIEVLQTTYAGIYRIDLVQTVPNENFLLAICTKE